MAGNQFDRYAEELVTILTDGERIEGLLFYLGGSRLSDFLNSPIQQESKFLKVKDATVRCRRSGEELGKVPFVMVARDRLVMVMTQASPAEISAPAPASPAAIPSGREPSTRFFR